MTGSRTAAAFWRRPARAEVSEIKLEGLDLVAPGLDFATKCYQGELAPTPERSGLPVGVARVP
ncbi:MULTISPECIES: hypothetical protein [Streptomyces]|uniref:Uncharacterized protein n=1 Tax=Streptomyces edwardsiae TaxID=3075527 RepID=A0ABU2PU83_9ACTN|nr:hypothetical protein [Streptomyces sp. DSM 41636]MDT0395727.1 hypothetical protein [Streptomyces sp. DSM 41636]